MREKVIEILKSLHPNVDFETHCELVDGGVLDSFDIIALVTELSEEFGVEIGVEHLEPENFNSAEGICSLLERLGQ